MKNIINNILEENPKHIRGHVNKLEYEVRDLSTKADIAELFLQIKEIKDALKSSNIEVKAMDALEKEKLIKEIIQEDKEQIMKDIGETLYQMNQKKALEKSSFVGNIRNWFNRKSLKHSSLSEDIKEYLENEDDETVALYKEILDNL